MCDRSRISGFLIFYLLLASPFLTYPQSVKVKKIWDKAPHNAFTDLVRYKSYFYCTFREGKNHVPMDSAGNGKIRIIRSKDGDRWESVTLLSNEKYDLRDPKLSVTPDKRLMVLMGGSLYVSGKRTEMLSHVSFSADGLNFTPPAPVSVEKNIRSRFDWIWRLTWEDNSGYAVVYQSGLPGNRNRVRLLTTDDGLSYAHLADLEVDTLPNESSIRFDGDDNMLILMRREANANGMLGISSPPYREWKWINLGFRLGGPNFILIKNGRLCLGTRLYKPGIIRTVIYITDRQGRIDKAVELPSGGDTSYPGMLIWRKKLWISYYSSHEGKTSIYLAKIRNRDLLHD